MRPPSAEVPTMPDAVSESSERPSLGTPDRERLQIVFRRLHGGPMQAVATAQILLAAWERAIAAGDTKMAAEAAQMLGDQIRSIGPALQEIEREGLELLSAAKPAPSSVPVGTSDED